MAQTVTCLHSQASDPPVFRCAVRSAGGGLRLAAALWVRRAHGCLWRQGLHARTHTHTHSTAQNRTAHSTQRCSRRCPHTCSAQRSPRADRDTYAPTQLNSSASVHELTTVKYCCVVVHVDVTAYTDHDIRVLHRACKAASCETHVYMQSGSVRVAYLPIVVLQPKSVRKPCSIHGGDACT